MLSGPWVHQLTLQPLPSVLQVWLPVFKVCPDMVECNLGSECCEESCVPKSWEKPAGASPLPLGATAQSCPCPWSSSGVGCRGVCAWLWTWLWTLLILTLTWLSGLASGLAYPCGLVWQSLGSWLNVVTVTRPVPLFLLGHCGTVPLYTEVLSLPALLWARLAFAPHAPQAPLQLLHCPTLGIGRSLLDTASPSVWEIRE